MFSLSISSISYVSAQSVINSSSPPDCSVSSNPACFEELCKRSRLDCLAYNYPERYSLTIGDNPYPGLRVISTSGVNYAESCVINAIQKVGTDYHQEDPNGHPIVVGDLSPGVGTDHKTPRGLQGGFLPMTSDGNIAPLGSDERRHPVTFVSPNYDQERTIDIIQRFIDNGTVRVILFDDPSVVDHFKDIRQLNGKPVVQFSPNNNHQDHFHIDFRC